jgi:hypothetical protein
MAYWLRIEADPPSIDMRPDGYSQGTTYLGILAWAAFVALGAWLAWG